MRITLLAELFATISDRGRQLLGHRSDRNALLNADAVLALAGTLLSRRGEASGIALASDLLLGYSALPIEEKRRFFVGLVQRFGADRVELDQALAAYSADPCETNAQHLHQAAESRRQELFRRLNRAPGGTRDLVAMRTDLLGLLRQYPELEPVDRDFVHLLSSWFNRGFLLLRRIDWSAPAIMLEKIITYEAVHAIHGWDDLRRRTESEDRRCFAFFHPALGDEPLIFVEVALTRALPDSISPLLAADRSILTASEATTAVFYSISNCQVGLTGISFGNFLIKQVAEELKRDLPSLTTFATLSPVPLFARWLADARRDGQLEGLDPEALAMLDQPEGLGDQLVRAELKPLLARAAALYFLTARTADNRPLDPVARFHLGNGARLERIDLFGDLSDKGLSQSHGVMVNYLYDLAAIEQNHEAYADTGLVTHSPEVARLLASRGK